VDGIDPSQMGRRTSWIKVAGAGDGRVDIDSVPRKVLGPGLQGNGPRRVLIPAGILFVAVEVGRLKTIDL